MNYLLILFIVYSNGCSMSTETLQIPITTKEVCEEASSKFIQPMIFEENKDNQAIIQVGHKCIYVGRK